MSGIVYLLDDRSYNIKDWLFELYVLRPSVHGAQHNHECVSADARKFTDRPSTMACTRSCHTHLITSK